MWARHMEGAIRSLHPSTTQYFLDRVLVVILFCEEIWACVVALRWWLGIMSLDDILRDSYVDSLQLLGN